MEILYVPDSCDTTGNSLEERRHSVVTIGAYDGVHLGHRAVIAEVRRVAQQRGDASVVVTFDRHPASVVRPQSAPLLLTNLEQKLELLESTGVDMVVVIRFDKQRSLETAEDFVNDLLVECLRASGVVVGKDFHFGHDRHGTVELLTAMGAQLGFSVEPHSLVSLGSGPHVSSTAIRHALTEGRIEDANAMLGTHHETRGRVVTGDRRGRTLGFPTANVAVANDILMPADGIYGGRLSVLDDPASRDLPSAIYVGKRPTFYDDQAMTLLEVHVLDFEGNLYGKDVSVTFDHMVRPDAKFLSIDELMAQLRDDCDQVRERLARRIDE